MMGRFTANEDGATMIEFSLIAFLLIIVTFGIAELGFIFWQWNSAEKATQIGARKAVVGDLVPVGLKSVSCCTSGMVAGEFCTNPAAASFGTINCSGATQTCTQGYVYSGAAMSSIVTKMQSVFPRINPENVAIDFTDVGLGFCGRQSPVPAITVRLVGMTYNSIILGPILGLATINMPDFRATLTGEDISSSGI